MAAVLVKKDLDVRRGEPVDLTAEPNNLVCKTSVGKEHLAFTLHYQNILRACVLKVKHVCPLREDRSKAVFAIVSMPSKEEAHMRCRILAAPKKAVQQMLAAIKAVKLEAASPCNRDEQQEGSLSRWGSDSSLMATIETVARTQDLDESLDFDYEMFERTPRTSASANDVQEASAEGDNTEEVFGF